LHLVSTLEHPKVFDDIQTNLYRLYTGYDTGPEPPFMTCAIQASLVYAMPILASVSLSAMVFQLWLCLRGTVTQAYVPRSKPVLWGVRPFHCRPSVVPTYTFNPAARRSALPRRRSLHHLLCLSSVCDARSGLPPSCGHRVLLQHKLPTAVSILHRTSDPRLILPIVEPLWLPQ